MANFHIVDLDRPYRRGYGPQTVPEGKPYDFNFDFTHSEQLVGTEVVYRDYEGIGDLSFKLATRADRMTLAAKDLVQMAQDHNGFEPVAGLAPTHDPGITVGDKYR